MKIKNGLVFTPEHTMEYKDLCFENGIITEQSDSGEFDAEGCYVLPGFIDTHIHGAYGVEFYECEYSGNIKQSLDYLESVGVTSVLITLATEQFEEYAIDCEKIVATNDERILGIHCEGPFVNPIRKGGLRPSALKAPDKSLITLIQEKSGGMLKILSISPELEGAKEVIDECVKQGIKVSMAHTNASFEEAQKGAEWGITRSTHTYNAMRPFSHRDPGPIGFALTDDRIECELICDLHHVSAPAIKLCVKAKGIDKVTMISDTSFFCGVPEAEYPFGDRSLIVKDGFARLPDGTISGSACPLTVGAKNMFDMGFTPAEIAVMASVNPARAADAHDRGELKNGYRADIIVLDKNFNLKAVFSGGKQVK